MRFVMMLLGTLAACTSQAQEVSCPPRGCSSDSDCASNQLCAFKVGSCAAVGECIEKLPILCNGQAETCGCCGTLVDIDGCVYPLGYASGPTTGDAGLSCLKP